MLTDSMEKTAEILEVQLGKAFYIKGRANAYMLTKAGIYKIVNDISTKLNDDTLELLLLGKLEIDDRYLPYKDEEYFIPSLFGAESRHWKNNDEDRYYFDHYLVCQTFAEASELWTDFMEIAKEKKDANKKPKGNPKNINQRYQVR